MIPDHSPFCLFTSISPRLALEELEYQRSCIASWRAAGFEVATVNGQAEVARIESLGLDVEIVARGAVGKPSISDILKCVADGAGQYVGIINADCCLLPYPKLADRLTEQLRGSVAIVERLDIADPFMPRPDSCSGFDGFFFDKSVVPTNFDPNFKIGVPWWDYCFPMAAAREGARIFNIETPLLTHKVHTHTWSEVERASVGLIFWQFLKKWRASEPESFPALGGDLDNLWSENPLTASQLDIVGLACFRWLQSCRSETPQAFLPASLNPIEALFRSQRVVLNQLNTKAERAKLLELRVDCLSAEIAAQLGANAILEHHLGAIRKRIEAIERSTSWRLTKPLRQFGTMLGALFRTRSPEK